MKLDRAFRVSRQNWSSLSEDARPHCHSTAFFQSDCTTIKQFNKQLFPVPIEKVAIENIGFPPFNPPRLIHAPDNRAKHTMPHLHTALDHLEGISKPGSTISGDVELRSS